MRTFFSANNVYFIKNTNIFSKKKVFFQLSFATNEQPYTVSSAKHLQHKQGLFSLLPEAAIHINFAVNLAKLFRTSI